MTDGLNHKGVQKYFRMMIICTMTREQRHTFKEVETVIEAQAAAGTRQKSRGLRTDPTENVERRKKAAQQYEKNRRRVK